MDTAEEEGPLEPDSRPARSRSFMGNATIRILLLEDDLETVGYIAQKLAQLEYRLRGNDIALTVYGTYEQVEKHVNDFLTEFDLILLDRDCKMAGSFHVLNIEAFGPERIISISSTPMWNEEAQARGVETVVWKDYRNLDAFSSAVAEKVLEKLGIQ